jgi:hypothetical protein
VQISCRRRRESKTNGHGKRLYGVRRF